MSFVFLLVLLPLIQVAYTLDYDYGVQKTYREKFASLNEDGTFKCLSSDLVIRVNQINNDFCDCPDGSDEPGTSACASNLLDVKFPTGWRFQCKNDGFNAQEILHNKVNDGICDCCDGSDEYAGATQCANICADVQEREAKELLLQVERKKISLEKKEKMIQQALIAREEDAPKIEEEKKELESLVNTRDEVAGELPSLEEREKAEKERLSGEFKVLKGFLEKPKDGEKGKPEFKNSCTKWRQTKDCVSKSETNQDKGCDDIISSNESGYCDCVDSKTNHTIKYEKNCDHKPLRCSFVCRASGEEGTLSNVDDVYFDMDLPPPYSLPAANDLREKLKELDGKIEKLRSSIKVRADRLSRNISNEDILRTLTDQCFTLDIKVYTYELCMFKNTHQYSKGTSNGKNTGNWGRFGESTYSSWLSTDDYSRMLYENGDYCWNHEKRMTDVRIVCGPENVLLKVEEPMPCKYAMVFQTPAICE
uniref:Glucosidase 2 subunit beta n=1 Tax=Trypanosoma congolense (strain IL3000) TaxID=1068625 RepID=G0UPE8_TRYCI|nr:putative glucosidase II beta subunit [Trypanosoma congolense IL3000]